MATFGKKARGKVGAFFACMDTGTRRTDHKAGGVHGRMIGRALLESGVPKSVDAAELLVLPPGSRAALDEAGQQAVVARTDCGSK